MNERVEDALRVLIEYGNGSTNPEVQDAVETISNYLTTFDTNE